MSDREKLLYSRRRNSKFGFLKSFVQSVYYKTRYFVWTTTRYGKVGASRIRNCLILIGFISFLFFLLQLFLTTQDFVTRLNIVPQNKRLACIMDPKILNYDNCIKYGCIWDDEIWTLMQKDNSTSGTTIPVCYFPPNTGYQVDDVQGNSVYLKKDPKSIPCPYVFKPEDEFDVLRFTTKEIGAGLHISIEPVDRTRYRPPVPIDENPNIESSDKFSINIKKSPIFSFEVVRKSTNTKIWDTKIGGLMFAEQFLQIATMLPSQNIYGFGENVHMNLKHNLTTYKTWAMFSRDDKTDWGYDNTQGYGFHNYNESEFFGENFPYTETRRNFYSVHPFYLGIESDGKAHGVFIFNSNAQEVTLGPAPHLVYRTIGGMFDIFYFPGPTPEEVIQQYQQVIGRPMVPPYWALGFHQSKWGYYHPDEVLEKTNSIREKGIPIDVMTLDIDYMDRFKDFTYDKKNWSELPQLAKQLHKLGMKLEIVLDPGIEPTTEGWKRAITMDASFVEWPNHDMVQQEIQQQYPLVKNTKTMLYASWPNYHVAAPDFLDPFGKTTKWWAGELEKFHNEVGFDSIWLDLNEPSSFSTNMKIPWFWKFLKWHTKIKALRCHLNSSPLEIPPYRTHVLYHWENEGRPGDSPLTNYLSSKTLCMVGRTGRGKHTVFDTHNLYGLFEAMATKEGIKRATGKRGLVVARSTFPSAGKYSGHWLGDNSAEWKDLKHHIIGAMEFNMFGIPYVGADVCGFNEPPIEELCLRWMQMGAFSPFFRNHNNGQYEKDPAQWDSVAKAARKSNLFRYRHLPYLYSLHFYASLKGGTVMRPLFFEFPEDPITWSINSEFMWGSKMLIIPVVEPGQTYVSGYLPPKSTWYSIYDHSYGSVIRSGNNTFPAPLDYMIPVFVRAGSIIPRQRPGMTTVESRRNEFQLLVAPEFDKSTSTGQRDTYASSPKEILVASGELFWDDGDSIINDLHTYAHYHFEFEFFASKDDAYLKITRIRKMENLTLPTIDNIEIFGYEYLPNSDSMKLDGDEIHEKLEFDRENNILNITSKGLIDMNKNGPVWMLTWNNL